MVSLSKSKVMSSLQCPKRLHLEIHRPELKVFSPSTERIFAMGHRVGAIACRVLGSPNGAFIKREWGVEATLEKTAELIQEGAPAIYEAALMHENVLVYVDILRREGDAWRIVEVKSSSKVKDEHRLDCAIQTWVARGVGLPVAGVSLAHIDNTFVYQGEGRYAGLLHEEDLTAEIESLLPLVPSWVEDATHAVGPTEPPAALGSSCSKPYSCPFEGHCWPGDARYPVTGLGGSKDLLGKLASTGYSDIRDVPAGALTNKKHRRIHRVTRAGERELLEEAVRLVRELDYPRYYVDFETINPAIPVWPGTRPFQALPFQWSCHIERAPGSFEHAEFLDVSGQPPMRAFAETLLDTLGKDGPILTYSPYEARILRELAENFDDLAADLLSLVDRLVDLLPIAKANYYHPNMLGSWSIKAVLPTVAPDMDYAELEEVQDGQAAGAAYLEAIDPATSDVRREHLRVRLLKYCRFDTEAMVRLTHFFGSGGNIGARP